MYMRWSRMQPSDVVASIKALGVLSRLAMHSRSLQFLALRSGIVELMCLASVDTYNPSRAKRIRRALLLQACRWGWECKSPMVCKPLVCRWEGRRGGKEGV